MPPKKERPQQCDGCDEMQILRPYGEDGECLCLACIKKIFNKNPGKVFDRIIKKELFGLDGRGDKEIDKQIVDRVLAIYLEERKNYFEKHGEHYSGYAIEEGDANA